MADRKAAPGAISLVVEVVAGSGEEGHADGALSVCQFRKSYSLCRYGDSLIVVDHGSPVVKVVEGVLGFDGAAPVAFTGVEFEARAVPLIMMAIPVLPKSSRG